MHRNTWRCLVVFLVVGMVHMVVPGPLFSARIDVKYARRLRNSRRRISFEKGIGLPCRKLPVSPSPDEQQENHSKDGDSVVCGKELKNHYYRYDVPDDEEAFWETVLRASPAVIRVVGSTQGCLLPFSRFGGGVSSMDCHAARVVMRRPMTDSISRRQKVKAEGHNTRECSQKPAEAQDCKPRSPTLPESRAGLFVQFDAPTCSSLSQDEPDPKGGVPSLLLFFFSKTLACRGGRFRLLASDSNFLRFEADDLKGEIVSGRNFWEKMEATVVFFPVKEGLELHMFLDARYATSLGSTAPQDAAFSSLEMEFYREEQDYLEALLSSASTFLETRTTKH